MSLERNFLARQAQQHENSLATANSEQESQHIKHRRALGIPAELDTKPVLYLGSHRDPTSIQHKNHNPEFQRTRQAWPLTLQEEASTFIDLSQSSSGQVVELLRAAVLRTGPITEDRALPSYSGEDVPLPKYVTNVQFLPALDAHGKANEGLVCFALDQEKCQTMLPMIAEFLKQKGIVTRRPESIEDQL